ncbi:MAG: hypothetical protein FIB04_01290 [Gammaproteobacteria bacterium]|nr:hypothetical protein [Gammaproteobacteria bacterium]
MSAADKRIAELLDRWLASVDLHTRYLELDDDAYAKVQDWPKHQRPTKWVVELARVRLVELKRHLEERQAKGDAAFAESLELMSFLTTLLGSEHIERFIPMATGKPAGAKLQSVPQPEAANDTPTPRPKAAASEPPSRKSTGDTTTKQVLAVRTKSPRSAKPLTTSSSSAPKPVPVPPRAEPAPSTGAARVSEKVKATVIADAVRFLSWGREWPQLASSIARLADRPPEQEIWKILRAHRADIESQARRPPD